MKIFLDFGTIIRHEHRKLDHYARCTDVSFYISFKIIVKVSCYRCTDEK